MSTILSILAHCEHWTCSGGALPYVLNTRAAELRHLLPPRVCTFLFYRCRALKSHPFRHIFTTWMEKGRVPIIKSFIERLPDDDTLIIIYTEWASQVWPKSKNGSDFLFRSRPCLTDSWKVYWLWEREEGEWMIIMICMMSRIISSFSMEMIIISNERGGKTSINFHKKIKRIFDLN